MAEGGDFGGVEAEGPLAFDLDPVDGVGLVDAGLRGTPAGGVVGPLFVVGGGGQPEDVLGVERERRLDGVGPVCAAALVRLRKRDEVVALARAVVERFRGGGVEGPLVRRLVVAVEREAFPVAAVVEGVGGVPGFGGWFCDGQVGEGVGGVGGLALPVAVGPDPEAAVVTEGDPGDGVAILDAAVEGPGTELDVYAAVVCGGVAEKRKGGDEAKQGAVKGDVHVSTYILAVRSG